VVRFSEYKECFKKDKNQSKCHYNRNKNQLLLLQSGDYVNFKKRPKSDWLPAIIKERLKCNRSYIIEDGNGVTYRRNIVYLRFMTRDCFLKHDFDDMRSNDHSITTTNNKEVKKEMKEKVDSQVEDSQVKDSSRSKEYPYRIRMARENKKPEIFI